MKNTAFILLILPLFFSCDYQNRDASNNSEPENVDTSLVLPNGFTAYIYADSLGYGRHITVNENDDVYVSLRRENNGGGIAALRDTNNDNRADIIQYFGEFTGTGIGLHKNHLYFGSDREVVRYPMSEGELLPDQNYELIAVLPEQNQHASKPFTFDRDGNIYVNIGGPSNACMQQTRTKGSPGLDPCPQLERHAGIWRFRDDVTNQNQEDNGYRYATGLRNSMALDWNNQVDNLYAVPHGRDQLYQFFPDMYSEEESALLPAEEFFLLEEGADGGWPYCYYNQITDKKMLAPEYGGDRIKTGRCEKTTDPIMAFPGHLAPNDLIFYSGSQFPSKYHNGAFIAFHGSWNRSPLEQEGYFVVFVPFEGAYPSGDWEIFADNFDRVEKVMSPGDAVYRPCGLAEGPDGSLYVVDSRKGKVWKIQYEQ